MSANETQVAGDHYKDKAIQPWDYITSNNLGYLEGCIVKYVSRYQNKNGVEDLEKARHFLDKLIEVQSERQVRLDEAVLQEVMKWSQNNRVVIEEENKTIKKAAKATPKKRGRGRPRKAPYGYKANGKPYLRKPRNWKEEE